MRHQRLEEGGGGGTTTVNVNPNSSGHTSWLTPLSVTLMSVVIGVSSFTVGFFVNRALSDDETVEIITDNVEIITDGSGADAASLSGASSAATVGSSSASGGADEDELPYLTGESPPNVIFLLADDLGWADISHNGGQWSTPAIDSILENGVEFTKFYSHALCTPSRMAFLTGRFAWRLGVQYPEVIHAMMTAHIPEDEATFAEVTKDNGYDNYYVGRWGVGYASWAFTPLKRGWDMFYGYFGAEGGYYNHSTDHFDEWNDVYDLWDNWKPAIEDNGTYSEDLFYDKTLEYLEIAKAAGKPFTLTYAAQTGHDPISDDSGEDHWLNPPQTFDECDVSNLVDHEEDYGTYMTRTYMCNKVKYLDMVWGNVVQRLIDLDLWDNTLIFVTTDNGALPYVGFGQVGNGWGCNWPLRGTKVSHLEGGIKVWAGMSGGAVPIELRGTTHDGLTHITDFAATAMRVSASNSKMATLTNEEKGVNNNMKKVDGKNLYSLESHDMVVHNVFPQYLPDWIEARNMDYAVTDGFWKFYSGLPDDANQNKGWYNFPGQGVIDETNYPGIWKTAGGNCTHGCLFYLPTDPSEMKDLSGSYPEVVGYFMDVVQSIWRGGLDDDYHPGQNYLEDFRGWNEEGIMRPYLTAAAKTDYEARKTARTSLEYDYTQYPLTWSPDLTILNTDNAGEMSIAAGRADLDSAPIFQMFDDGGRAIDPMDKSR